MTTTPHQLLLHLTSTTLHEKRAMEKAGMLGALGRMAFKGLSSPTARGILRSGPFQAAEKALYQGASGVANHVLKHPKVYAPVMRNAGKIVGTGAATAATGAVTSPLWSPSVSNALQRLKQTFFGPAEKHAAVLHAHLLNSSMVEKRAGGLGTLWNVAKGAGPKLLSKIPGWTAGANAARAGGTAAHLRNAAGKMTAGSPEHAATEAASKFMRGQSGAPGGFFGNMRYGIGKMNPGNSYRLNTGMGRAAFNGALPIATGAGGSYLGWRNGVERGAADTMSEFEQMPWYKMMAFGAPNVFGHRQWAMDKALQNKQENAGWLQKIFGPDYGDIRNRLDNNRQRFDADRSDKWDQWISNIKNVFAQ